MRIGAVFSQADSGIDPDAIRQFAIDSEAAGFEQTDNAVQPGKAGRRIHPVGNEERCEGRMLAANAAKILHGHAHPLPPRQAGVGHFERADQPVDKRLVQMRHRRKVMVDAHSLAAECCGQLAHRKAGKPFPLDHLEGGILKYLETVPQAQSRWQGDCFVFDERVSVGQGLSAGH